MTVQHIVLIEFNDDVSDAAADEILEGIRGLKGKIPGVLDVQAGKNFTNRAPNVTHAAIVVMADKETLEGYGPHDAHQELLKTLMPAAKNLSVVDFEI